MNKIIQGRAWKFGDKIDTDIITPVDTTTFGLADPEEVRMVVHNAFRPIKPDFHKMVKKGDILVAGRNFGFGSHREQANTVLAHLGFSALVAESIARIYFRNSIAIGFVAFEVPGITKIVQEGDELQIDMQQWKLKNLNSGAELHIEPYTELVQKILEAGGILNMLRQRTGAG